MSESDTFLDEILDGVTTVPQPAPQAGAEAQAPAPIETAQARPAPRARTWTSCSMASPLLRTRTVRVLPSRIPRDPIAIPKADENTETLEEPIAVVEATPTTEVPAPAVDLPVAAPHEILGLPGQAEVSHFDLANEVNGIAVAEPAAEVADSHSFAAIAREIAATVDDSSRKSSGEAGSAESGLDTDRASFLCPVGTASSQAQGQPCDPHPSRRLGSPARHRPRGRIGVRLTRSFEQRFWQWPRDLLQPCGPYSKGGVDPSRWYVLSNSKERAPPSHCRSR